MVARLNQTRLDPKDVPAMKDFMHSVVVPEAREQPGFRNMILLSGGDGHTLVIDFYDTAEQARETEKCGWYQRMVEGFEDKLQGQVRRNFYDVTVGLETSNPAGYVADTGA